MGLPYRSEDAAGLIWPSGSYQARIEKAEEARSQAGNDMLKLTWQVWAPDGQSRLVYDYIVLNKPKGVERLGMLAAAIGKRERFERNKLDVRDLTGAIATVSLGLKTSKDPKYGDDNGITAYSELTSLSIAPRGAADSDEDDGDAPF
jgi:hypothetical protein